MSLHESFLSQARSCAALGSPFMARLMTVLADHWPDHTALARKVAAWPGDITPAGASLPLRIAGGLHALVLEDMDPVLATVYPPCRVDDAALRDEVIAALIRHDDDLCDWVDSAPQTNEVRRSAVLIAIAHWLDARFGLPLLVSELGASAGLNLLFDQFSLCIGRDLWGPARSQIKLAPDWRGALPPRANPRIAKRRGVDLNPLRAGRNDDSLRLMAYLWPDQPDRIARTRAAMALPQATVDRSDAVDWLAQRLGQPTPGNLHLIYHTIAWQYFPAAQQAKGRALIAAAGAKATSDTPLAWFGMEADDNPNGAGLTLRLWPGDLRFDLGRAGFHGQWVEWSGA
jgi:hypothetical protein